MLDNSSSGYKGDGVYQMPVQRFVECFVKVEDQETRGKIQALTAKAQQQGDKSAVIGEKSSLGGTGVFVKKPEGQPVHEHRSIAN